MGFSAENCNRKILYFFYHMPFKPTIVDMRRLVISFLTLYVKILNSTVWIFWEPSQNIIMHKMLLYVWSIVNEDWYIGFIQNKNNFLENIILWIKFKRRTIFTFSYMFFLITYSYKASFCQNVIKAQWHGSHTTQRKYRWNIKKKNYQKNLNISSVFFFCVQFHKW